MATVKIDRFGGIMPRLHPTALQDGMAVEAHNCVLKSGKLVPLRQPSFVDSAGHTIFMENGLGSMGEARSLYCWKHTLSDGSVRTDFLAFPGNVDFSRGNIADDEHDRVFVTGDTGQTWTTILGETYENVPCVYLFDRSTGTIDRHVLCKEKMQTPKCTLAGTLDENAIVYAYFFLTWVDKYGYESPCSLPSENMNDGDASYGSDPLKCNTTCKVTFGAVTVPSGAVKVRVYKTNAGDETDNIQFIREYAQNELVSLSRQFTVDIDDTTAGETMPEIEAIATDAEDMTFVPGNFYAARSRSKPHTVMFSDVDNPSNWPMAYQYDIKDNVVRLAVTSNTVFALTDGYPYVMSGTAPESMTVSSLAGPAACVSERGVCVFHNAVYFVSNYGLYTIYNDADAGTLCQCMTEAYFTKDQWQALNPRSCVMGQFDGRLYLFFTLADGTHKSLVVDMAESACALTTHDEAAMCVCTDDTTDDMYFARVEGA